MNKSRFTQLIKALRTFRKTYARLIEFAHAQQNLCTFKQVCARSAEFTHTQGNLQAFSKKIPLNPCIKNADSPVSSDCLHSETLSIILPVTYRRQSHPAEIGQLPAALCRSMQQTARLPHTSLQVPYALPCCRQAM